MTSYVLFTISIYVCLLVKGHRKDRSLKNLTKMMLIEWSLLDWTDNGLLSLSIYDIYIVKLYMLCIIHDNKTTSIHDCKLHLFYFNHHLLHERFLARLKNDRKERLIKCSATQMRKRKEGWKISRGTKGIAERQMARRDRVSLTLGNRRKRA